MLLMDRLFRLRGLNTSRIGPLERLTYIGGNAMGAMSFAPLQPDAGTVVDDIPLVQLAAEIAEVLEGEGGSFCTDCFRQVVHPKEQGRRRCSTKHP